MKNKTKKAWFQGSDTAVDKIVSNDPDKLGYPGEVGYDRKPMAVPVGGDSRDWEQSWFEGAANKTKKNLGPAGEEFKTKQHWQRIPMDEKIANAKITAGFTRTAKPGDSFWSIYAQDKTGGTNKQRVLKATLNQIWGEELNKETAHLSATPEYGKAVLAFVDELGFSKVAFLMTGNKSFLKKADWANDDVEVVEDAGDIDAVVEIDDEASAIDSEVDATAAEGEVTVDLLEQKKQEIESIQTMLVENTAPESTADVFVELQDAEKMLDESAKELAAVVNKLRVKTLTAKQKIQLIKIAAEAGDDAIDTLTSSDDVAAKAQEAIEAANAAIEAAEEVAEGGEGDVSEEMIVDVDGGEGDVTEFVADADGAEDDFLEEAQASSTSKFLKARANARKKALAMSEGESQYGVVPDGAPKDGQGEIDSAHPQGGHNLTEVSVGGKPKDNGERFETVSEAQEVDLAVANKMPSGNLNSAAASATAAAKGKVAKASTVKRAAADKSAVDYFNELYGQGDAASKEFGHAISKDAVPGGNMTGTDSTASANVNTTSVPGGNVDGKAVAAAVANNTLKVKRAFVLAEVAANKGLCAKTAEAKAEMADNIMNFDENAFAAFKNVVDNTPDRVASIDGDFVKKASVKLPQVGQVDGGASEDAFISKLSSFNWRI